MHHLVESMCEILFVPYEASKRSMEESGVGASPMDREVTRFWKRVAWGGITLLILLMGGGGFWLWMLFQS